MSGVLKTIGQVAGIAATISAFIPSPLTGPFGPITLALTAVALAANIGAQITAKKPPVQGSASGITIGATMAALCIIGESYCGGARVKQVGYGTENEVPNAWAWVVDVYSVAGPLEALVERQIDFNPVTFSGTAATGYYADGLWSDYQLGDTPEASALTPQEAGAPGWDASSKLSGKAAIGWSALWPKNGKMFGSGFPQTGAIWQGIKTWDPRDDSTYPGGSGTSRWADPVSDAAGHETAKATWTYNNNGGIQALRYALGSWERDETGSDPYIKVFGVGLKLSQIVVEDFVELANVCDANGWTVNGVLREGQGISKWDNLKRILGACAAEPVWKGGRLGVRINAPRIALDTIEMDDIAEGEPTIPGTRAYEERKNTLIPKFVDPDSKWELVPSGAVTRSEYLAEDGEERSEEWTLELVTDANQATQVTGYELVNRREQGPITLPLKPRLRGYPPGTLLAVSAEVQAEFGIRASEVLVTGKVTDVEQLSWLFNLTTETEDKHDFALGLTGAAPPPPYIPDGEERDDSGSYTGGNTPSTVADEAALLALDVPVGTIVKRLDNNQTYFFNGGTSGTIADWTLIATSIPTGVTAFGASLIDDPDAATARATLGLVIGTNVQAYDADLTTWAGITPGTGVGTALAVNTGTAGAFVVNGGALGTPSSGTLTNATGLPLTTGVTGTLPVANGGTGVTTSTGSGSTVLSISPTFTGTIGAAAITATGNIITTGGDFLMRNAHFLWGRTSGGVDTRMVGLNGSDVLFLGSIDAVPANISIYGGAVWATFTASVCNLVSTAAYQIGSNTVITSSRHIQLRSYTVATLPSAATAAQEIYVSNETGGATPAFSDGTNWRRVSDRAIVA